MEEEGCPASAMHLWLPPSPSSGLVDLSSDNLHNFVHRKRQRICLPVPTLSVRDLVFSQRNIIQWKPSPLAQFSMTWSAAPSVLEQEQLDQDHCPNAPPVEQLPTGAQISPGANYVSSVSQIGEGPVAFPRCPHDFQQWWEALPSSRAVQRCVLFGDQHHGKTQLLPCLMLIQPCWDTNLTNPLYLRDALQVLNGHKCKPFFLNIIYFTQNSFVSIMDRDKCSVFKRQ